MSFTKTISTVAALASIFGAAAAGWKLTEASSQQPPTVLDDKLNQLDQKIEELSKPAPEPVVVPQQPLVTPQPTVLPPVQPPPPPVPETQP